MTERNGGLRRNSDLINLIAAILLTVLQTYQASQARIIQERLTDIESRQNVILQEMD